MTDFPDWQAPQAHATAIADTGVPLLTGTATVINASHGVGAGAPRTLGPFTVTQIGYELQITATIGAAATNPFVTVQLDWFDSASNTLVQSDSFSAVCGTATLTNFVTCMRGPTKGDQVKVTLTNADPSLTATVVTVMLQNSRVYTADLIYWLNLWPTTLAVPAFTLPTLPPDENCLGVIGGQAIAASSSVTRLFAPFNGPVLVGINMNTGALSSLSVFLAPTPTSVYGGNNPIYGDKPSVSAFTVGGARAPIRVVLTNTATTSITVTFGLWRGQQV